MSFKKDNYTIIRKAIDKDLANFNLNYLLVKKQVFETCLKTKYISPYEDMLGNYEDEELDVGHNVPLSNRHTGW